MPTSASPPFSELFLWEPGLNARLLPWIVWQQQAQGLLYYGTIFWETIGATLDDVAEDGTVLPSWGERGAPYNGGGVLVYPGGKRVTDPPQASVRLALLREGLQDYEWLCLLRERVEARRRAGRPVPPECAALLRLPPDLVADAANYTKEVSKVLAYRERLADAIERLGEKP